MMENSKKVILVVTLVTTLIGCGGGGGGESAPVPAPEAVWDGAVNTQGYPVVNARYSFTTSPISVTCSDESTATFPAISFNSDVVQNINEISMVSLSNSNPAAGSGISITSEGKNRGTVQKNGAFIATKLSSGVVTATGLSINFNYNISGIFTSSGWKGDYVMVASFITLGESCSYTSTFSGSKIIVREGVDISDMEGSLSYILKDKISNYVANPF